MANGDVYEAGYLAGSLSARTMLLQELLKHFPASRDNQNWQIERAAAIVSLRRLCATVGDNDWPDDLYLSDIIDNHLGDYIE